MSEHRQGGVSVMSDAAGPPSGLGRVLHLEEGVLVVLTGGRRCTVTLGPAMLAHLARTSGAGPGVGDLVQLRWWPDGPVTVSRVLRRATQPGGGVVLPLRRR